MKVSTKTQTSKPNKNHIEKRKKEFIKRENENQELVVNGYGSFIGLTQKGVTVRREGRVIFQQPASTLSHIVISGKGITLSSNLIEYCLDNKIPIDFFGSGNRHNGSILSNKIIEGSLWKEQASCSKLRRNMLAKSIIWSKVKNQLHLIKYFHKYHKISNPLITETLKDFEEFFNSFDQFIKTDNISDDESFIPFLMSQEANAAVKYWKCFRVLLADDKVKFEGREQQGVTDVVNCMLNYGYAILYSRVWQALLKARLNPFDSVIHARQSGKPTFVFDVVEIFRAQVVDRVVISLVQKRHSLVANDGLLDEDTKTLLSKSILQRLNRYEVYGGERMSMERIIKTQANEIAFFFRDETASIKPYVSKW